MTLPNLLTLGEPAGIGPDCVLLAFHNHPEIFEHVVVVAPPAWLSERAGQLGLSVPIHRHENLDGYHHAGGKLNIWNPCSEADSAAPVTPGRASPATAAAVVACIEAAAKSCIQGKGAAVVTAPIEKAVLRETGFAFPGHTEFLAHVGNTEHVVMMLASDQLRIALLTTHMALADVPKAISYQSTLETIRITHRSLQRQFGITSPKLALCGLNPHAGEQGHFGLEEGTILMPAVAEAREAGNDIDGPLPADTLFSPAMREKYDAIICCYHDQGLIPIKTLSFGEAVNITLGLPFIRTSVDHGTAFDRAATGNVSYSSIMEAIAMARSMADHQRNTEA